MLFIWIDQNCKHNAGAQFLCWNDNTSYSIFFGQTEGFKCYCRYIVIHWRMLFFRHFILKFFLFDKKITFENKGRFVFNRVHDK